MTPHTHPHDRAGHQDLPDHELFELMASLEDGLADPEQVDEDTFDRLRSAFGPETVHDAIVAGSVGRWHSAANRDTRGQGASSSSSDQPEHAPLPFKQAHNDSEVAASPASGWKGPLLALAAAVALAFTGALYLGLRSGPPDPTGGTTVAVDPGADPFDDFEPIDLPQDADERFAFTPPRLPPDLGEYWHHESITAGGTTLGAGRTRTDATPLEQRLATVIVVDTNGHGSGFLISEDGWIVTNHHVVNGALSAATLRGGPAQVQVILPELAPVGTQGQFRQIRGSQDRLPATVYRVSPSKDLALIRLDTLPEERQLFYLDLAPVPDDLESIGDEVWVIGSPGRGVAWDRRSCRGSILFDFPTGLTDVSTEQTDPQAMHSRVRAAVIRTGCSISGGDSGGPLVDSLGRVLGVTFATPTNRQAGSIGFHIFIDELRDFLADLPETPEASPFDIWSAGDPLGAIVAGRLSVDPHANQRFDAVFAASSAQGPPRQVAEAIFWSLGRQSVSSSDAARIVPSGLWGAETSGNFPFDYVVLRRGDRLSVLGVTDRESGVLSLVRVDLTGNGAADITWTRDTNGVWNQEDATVRLFESASIERLNPEAARHLESSRTPQLDRTQKQEKPIEQDGGGPNIIR